MPIKQKDFGKFKYPSIYIVEIDNSIIEIPVQTQLINLVPGFSRKGTINKPIYITNPTDFVAIYGDIDKNLEKKGSYFHRTVLKMLETGPVWALNLLETQDDRDKIQWVSVSVAAAFDNDNAERTIPYSKIFNRQDFWEREDETFLDYLKQQSLWNDDRLLQLTNVSDKNITVFIYKSSITGFDVTAEEWYNGKTNVPSYIHYNDYISDYLVTVLIIAGDWTDYKSLSVDSVYGSYFTVNGLIKANVQDFVNLKNVTVLDVYDVSLIPYFQDLSNRDMYIKTVINSNTEKTGLFCSYNEELLLNSDYATDKLDIIGEGLVDNDKSTINFLSYNQSISESLTYTNTYLDSAGNVFGNYNISLANSFVAISSTNRDTATYTNGYVNNTRQDNASGNNILDSVKMYKINKISGNTFYHSPVIETYRFTTSPIANGDVIYFNKSYNSLDPNNQYIVSNLVDNGSFATYRYTFNITDISGNTITNLSDIADTTSDNVFVSHELNLTFTIGANAYYNLNNTRYILNSGGSAINQTLKVKPMNFDILDATNLLLKPTYSVFYIKEGDTVISVTDENYNFTTEIILGYAIQNFTNNPSDTGFTNYVDSFTVNYVGVTIDNSNADSYIPLGNDIIAISATTNSLSFNFNVSTGNTIYSLYRRDNAFNEIVQKIENGAADGRFLLINKNTGDKLPVYSNYTILNYNITFNNLTNTSNYYNGSNGFLFYYNDIEIVITNNNTDRISTSLKPAISMLGLGQTTTTYSAVIGKQSTLYQNYFNGIINNGDFFYYNNNLNAIQKFFIDGYFDQSQNLTIDIVSDMNALTPISISNFSTNYSGNLIIYSNIGNLKQSVEIQNISTYTDLTNVRSIYINKSQYTNVKKGDFIETYYDESALEYDELPVKLTRIISITNDPNYPNYKILTTNFPIKFINNNGGYYTTIYPTVDKYVSNLKGFKIKPFKISQDSIPNNTDTRINDILSVLDKTKNLAKALANKNKISWRYLVDSFGLGLDISAYPGGSKQQLVDLCGLKLNCLGFINMPSAKEFKNSANPSFINDDGSLNTYYLMQGGNEDLNPNFLYEFGNGVGQSCSAYFFPYLRISDNGIPKLVPPASFAATTYMQKFITNASGIYPWTICAGISDGGITGIGGTEIDFNGDDLINLYNMGANTIVYKAGNGYCIDCENTAQIYPYSSLSLIHSREVLIELENEMYDMLVKYQWKFNTPEVRSQIKYKADEICRQYKQNSALYDYKNVIDESNNTDTIIDLSMGVLDTYVEIIKGMGTIVNNITILKKGTIASGGFLSNS
jgi:hypothetical protein